MKMYGYGDGYGRKDVKTFDPEERRRDRLYSECAGRCGSCRYWMKHGVIGECTRADYMLVTRPEDECILRNRR